MATTFENKLEEKPILAELVEHVRVGSNWYLLGVLFKLDEIKLNDIREMKEGNDFKASLMFQLWLRTNPNATRRQVIDVLKKESIKEITVADKYEKALRIQSKASAQVFEDTTNQIAPLDQNDRTSYECSAISVFQRHFGRLRQSLEDPISVARILHNEKIISETVLNSVKSASQTLEDRRIILLTALQDAINSNYQFLKVFADALLKFTENVPLANAILKDYTLEPALSDREIELGQPATESQEAVSHHLTPAMKPVFSEIRSKFGSTFFRVRKAILKNSPLIEDLKTFLKDIFPDLKPQLAHVKTIDDTLDIIRDKCTLIDINYLETFVEELEIQEAKSYIEEYKSYMKEFRRTVPVKLCLHKSFKVNSSSFLKGETATFILDWDHNNDKCVINDIEEVLSICLEELSIYAQVKVINKTNSIEVVCTFPLSFAALLIAKAQETIDCVKKRGLIRLRIGYCIIFDKSRTDKEDETSDLKRKVDYLEERLKEERDENEKKIMSLQNENTQLKKMNRVSLQLQEKLTSVQKEKEVHKQEKINELTREDKEKNIEMLKETETKTKLTENERDMKSNMPKINTWTKSSDLSERLDETVIATQKNDEEAEEVGKLATIESISNDKPLERMNKAKTLEIEQLKSALCEQKKEIETLQKKMTSLSLQLMEKQEKVEPAFEMIKKLEDKDKNIEMLGEKISVLSIQMKEKEAKITMLKENERNLKSNIAKVSAWAKSFNPELSQKLDETVIATQDNDENDEAEEVGKPATKGYTGDIEWCDNYVVELNSPNMEQCEEVMTKLKEEKQEWSIRLKKSSSKIALQIVNDLSECPVNTLDIRFTPLTSTFMSKLSEVLHTTAKTLKRLVLFDSPFPGGIKQLTNAISVNTSLQELVLENVPITDEDAFYLSSMLRTNQTLKLLRLVTCNVTDRGFSYISEGLVKNKAMTSLFFSNNPQITSASTDIIVDLMKNTKSLEVLHLAATSLKDNDIEIICNTLVKLDRIKILMLSKKHQKACETFDCYEDIKDQLQFW